MSFLGLNRLLYLVADSAVRLVDGLSDREIEKPEGTGFDLRAASIYELKGHGELHAEYRKTPEVERIWQSGDEPLPLIYGRYYLVKTAERINMPLGHVGLIRPRSTLYRSGVLLTSGQINPGYRGELTFGLANMHPTDFILGSDARIAHMLVAECSGETSPYRGQWQGGRVSARTLEKQV